MTGNLVHTRRPSGRKGERRPSIWFGILTLLGGLFVFAQAHAQIGVSPKIDIVEEIDCLALNIYFEARGEPKLGQVAVGHVVLNRVVDKRFPETVCGVIRQGGEKKLNRCQFSWWCDGRSDRPRDAEAWQEIRSLAREVYWGFAGDPTTGALWYHALSVSPSWGKRLTRGPQIGQHLFYIDAKAASPQTASLVSY
jgi:spore germination cell wall hydrolase CwlJ-like protein